MDAERFFTRSLRDPRVARILAAALDAVDPGAAVNRYLTSNPLPSAQRIFALGLGKAAVSMTRALSRFTDITRALVITKHAADPGFEPATVMESGHPVPDERSQAAGEAALEFVTALREDDLLVCLISGGGSALMTAPLIPLEDLQALTTTLLASGARIDQINTLRRHLDRVKGGGIAMATKARVLSLILSDVVGSPLEAIASGPTAPDPTTKEDALFVLEKYGLSATTLSGTRLRQSARNLKEISDHSRRLADRLPLSILQSLISGFETPKPNDPIFTRAHNVIVGDNALAVAAALKQAEREGFYAESLGSGWQGEARDVGVQLAQKLRVTRNQVSHPFCLIAGGETTVTLKKVSSLQSPRLPNSVRKTSLPQGSGGRNQELALAAVPALAGLENILLVSLATDGEDGPTDAAGAVVNGETLRRADQLGLDVAGHLSAHAAYPFFERLDDLIQTGPTGTNVNDLVFLYNTSTNVSHTDNSA
jgi:glycerate 2-kinase